MVRTLIKIQKIKHDLCILIIVYSWSRNLFVCKLWSSFRYYYVTYESGNIRQQLDAYIFWLVSVAYSKKLQFYCTRRRSMCWWELGLNNCWNFRRHFVYKQFRLGRFFSIIISRLLRYIGFMLIFWFLIWCHKWTQFFAQFRYCYWCMLSLWLSLKRLRQVLIFLCRRN